MATIVVNGVRREVQAPTDTPLLYVLRNDLELSGPQFGCGLAQCGACSVLLGRQGNPFLHHASLGRRGQGSHHARRAPRAVGASRRGFSPAEAEKTLHPVQQAWIEEQTPLCGFCQNGMMIKATELLETRRDADRRRDQSGVYDLGSVGASLPLRKLHRDHRGRPARRHVMAKGGKR